MSARQTESERSSDAVCGTDDASRRLRRSSFRRLRLRALMARRLRTAVIDANGSRNHECPSDGVWAKPRRSLRNGWCQPSTPTIVVPQTSSAGTHGLPTPPSVFHANGDPNHECPSDGVWAKPGRSLRNGWCQPSTPTIVAPQTSSAGTHGLPTPLPEATLDLPLPKHSCKTAVNRRLSPGCD